jgi:hypothetical protein
VTLEVQSNSQSGPELKPEERTWLYSKIEHTTTIIGPQADGLIKAIRSGAQFYKDRVVDDVTVVDIYGEVFINSTALKVDRN